MMRNWFCHESGTGSVAVWPVGGGGRSGLLTRLGFGSPVPVGDPPVSIVSGMFPLVSLRCSRSSEM